MLSIEDGYFVSFFTDDSEKRREPRAIVMIEDGAVTIAVNPKAPEEDRNWLKNLALMLRSLKKDSEEYDDVASRLNAFWDWNGYTPNPSDYIAPKDYAGKYDKMIADWKL